MVGVPGWVVAVVAEAEMDGTGLEVLMDSASVTFTMRFSELKSVPDSPVRASFLVTTPSSSMLSSPLSSISSIMMVEAPALVLDSLSGSGNAGCV